MINISINGDNKDNVRYTTVLHLAQVNALKEMARTARIPSVNKGIRMAVQDFIETQNKRYYEQKMREAARDEAYLNRLADAQDDFAIVDEEEMSSW